MAPFDDQSVPDRRMQSCSNQILVINESSKFLYLAPLLPASAASFRIDCEGLSASTAE